MKMLHLSPDRLQGVRQQTAFTPPLPVGVLVLTGADRLSFLQSYTTNDILGLAPGSGCTTAISNWRGTVTDFVRVVARHEDLLLIGSTDRTAIVRQALDRFRIRVDVHLTDMSGHWRSIEVMGPNCLDVVVAGRELPLDHHAPVAADLQRDPAGPGLAIRTRGLEGVGVTLLIPASADLPFATALARAGALALGAEEWEYLRIAAGIPRFGVDMGEDTNVWEARLDRSVSMNKGCYLGQEIVARLFNYQKVQRYLMGIDFARSPARPAPGAAVTVAEKR
ncbi:MAG: hypothetical protein KGR26_03225, partial [Cyanobacteria bacterium REEB65]|nr:hypothetical protein [Cyanobacteria bacterium REEB65]